MRLTRQSYLFAGLQEASEPKSQAEEEVYAQMLRRARAAHFRMHKASDSRADCGFSWAGITPMCASGTGPHIG